MTSRRSWKGGWAAGFSIAEVVAVCAILGVAVATSVPFFLRYYQSAVVKAGAEELAAYLNEARQTAIKQNTSVCVHSRLAGMHFHVGGCGGPRWIGPGTDTLGVHKRPANIMITDTSDLNFTYLGAAAPASTYTVTNTTTNQTLRVTVAASGRISIGP